MEAAVKYVSKHITPLIYLIILVIISYYAYIYYYRGAEKRPENFQDMNVISGGSIIPTKLPKATCEALTTQIAQYKQVKAENPDTEIRNLDETIQSLTKIYSEGSCS
jgi:hypothetical protein